MSTQDAPSWRSDAGLGGRSVVVTGAAGGLGRAVCRAFAEAGSRVLAVDVPGSPVDAVVADLPGGPHRGVAADLRDLGTHDSLFEQAQAMAPLAALAHLAAVLRRRAGVDDVTEADWDDQADVNLKATFFLDRSAWRAFRAAGTGGAIVNFASQGWWTGGYGGSVVYSATKGGVVSLTRGLARSFAADGVRVNAVSPGAVDTPMLRDGMTDDALDAFRRLIPMDRFAAPSELAGAVLYLASDASSYVTGTVLNVSGGQLMY
jgi:NAD(P)-dependent dehydrogenase (short-subunit alcohol dehydrogenase family)